MSDSRSAPDGAPTISVVICTHNRAAHLRRAIESVLAQDVPASSFELLIVDNASTDDTPQVCAAFAGRPNVRRIPEPRLGLCHARNTGWRTAAGRYVAYLDDDATARPGWLAAIGAAFDRTPEPGAVGGRIDPVWEAERPPWLSHALAVGLTIIDWSDEPRLIPDVRAAWLAGANMALPAAVLRETGGFHPALDRVGTNMLSSGDVFLQKEVIARGYPCLYYPGMAVDHLVPASRLRKEWFVRRYYWQGISDAVMQLIAERPGPARRAAEAARRAARLLTSPRKLRALRSSSDDPDAFTERCFALIDLGHVAGLLGAARR